MTSCTQPMRFAGRDEFQRENMADKIITLLTSEVDISPMLIDGDWGTGKTEFCQKLITKFKDTYPDYKLIYIDAFKADHADNPLMTVLATVFTSIQGEGGGEKRKRLMEKALPVLRFTAKSLGKAAIGHIFRQDADTALSGLEEEIRNAANTASDAAIEATLKNHGEAENDICALKALLEEVTQNSPMVIFVDELDRCRPDFAVQMVEVIKHIFDVKSVQFVLITNTKQLIAAIHHRYGAAVDAQRYLDKFLKFSCVLSQTIDNHWEKEHASLVHYKNLIQSNPNLRDLKLTDSSYVCFDLIKCLIAKHEISLREIETFIRHLNIYQIIANKKLSIQAQTYNVTYLIGIFIFSMNPSLAKKILTYKISAEEIIDYLALNEFSRDNYSPLPTFLKLIILGCAPETPLKTETHDDMAGDLEKTVTGYFGPYLRHEEQKDFVYSLIVSSIKDMSLHS